MTETKLRFTGVGEKEQNQYEAEIEFYGNVDVEVSFLNDRIKISEISYNVSWLEIQATFDSP